MAKPRMIGTVNGYCVSDARIGRKRFTFNGTVSGLTNSAIKAGAKIGTVVMANFGGGETKYVIASTPWDDRCNGVWARQS